MTFEVERAQRAAQPQLLAGVGPRRADHCGIRASRRALQPPPATATSMEAPKGTTAVS